METFVVIWVLCAFTCAVIASGKNLNVATWFLLGLVLGVFALIIVIVTDKADPAQGRAKLPWKCPRCGKLNQYYLQKCSGKIAGNDGSKEECTMTLKEAESQYVEVSGNEKKCPMCAEMVKKEAKICRFCQYKFE